MSLIRVTVAVGALAACGGTMKIDATEARQAVYVGSFPEILAAANDAVQDAYKKSVVNPQEQVIQTPWHQLPLTEHVTTREEDTSLPGSDGSQYQDPAFDQRRARRMEATDRTMRYFVRFDVHIQQVGGKPNAANAEWKIVVEGFASKWDGTARPQQLDGAETPYWLDNRINKLQVAIHDKLKPRMKPAPRATPASG